MQAPSESLITLVGCVLPNVIGDNLYIYNSALKDKNPDVPLEILNNAGLNCAPLAALVPCMRQLLNPGDIDTNVNAAPNTAKSVVSRLDASAVGSDLIVTG